METQPINVAQELEQRFQKMLKEAKYPGKIHSQWREAAEEMLKNHSLLSLGTSYEDYYGILKSFKSWDRLTMMQFAVLSNALEASTPNQISHGNIEKYAEVMEKVHEQSVVWNEESTRLRGEAKKEVEMLLAASGGIKGEA